jgi:hypothetical protein
MLERFATKSKSTSKAAGRSARSTRALRAPALLVILNIKCAGQRDVGVQRNFFG